MLLASLPGSWEVYGAPSPDDPTPVAPRGTVPLPPSPSPGQGGTVPLFPSASPGPATPTSIRGSSATPSPTQPPTAGSPGSTPAVTPTRSPSLTITPTPAQGGGIAPVVPPEVQARGTIPLPPGANGVSSGGFMPGGVSAEAVVTTADTLLAIGADVVRVQIPGGAVPAGTRVQLRTAPLGAALAQAAAAQGLMPTNLVFELSLQPTPAALQRPAAINVRYQPEQAAGLREETRALYRYEETSQRLEALQNCRVSAAERLLSCASAKVGLFLLAGSPAANSAMSGPLGIWWGLIALVMLLGGGAVLLRARAPHRAGPGGG